MYQYVAPGVRITDKNLCSCSGEQLNIIAAVLANSIACGLSSDEVSILAALATLVGDALNVIATQRGICTENKF